MTEMELATLFPFGVHFHRPQGDVVTVVGRGNGKLLVEHHGGHDLTWVTVASTDGWRRMGEL